jgi:3-dehydroquinate synthase
LQTPGEATKSFTDLARLCDRLLEAGIERGDCIVAFGGGVIGDLAGFAAAIVLRGIGFIQVPTTLLAQVDSSVGGKTGINSKLGKNLIGAFHQPRLVIADTGVLSTLPRRELAAGYAEVAKYGLIGDAAVLCLAGSQCWRRFRRRSRRARPCHPGELPGQGAHCRRRRDRGRGSRAAQPRPYLRARARGGSGLWRPGAARRGGGRRHGDGVPVLRTLGVCRRGAAARVAAHLASVGLPTGPHDLALELPGPDRMLEIMRQDKKARSGQLTLILARDIAEAFVAPDIADADILGFLAEELRRP